MFDGLIQLFIDIMQPLVTGTAYILRHVLPEEVIGVLVFNEFNIYLFSDTGWFTEPIPIMYIMFIILFFLIFFFLLRLLWKGTKKLIMMVFGVFRV